MRKPLIVGILAIGAAGFVLWVISRGDPEVRIDQTNSELVASGEALYRQHCASCHGAKLEGQPNWTSRDERGRMPAPPHDDSGHTWHHDDQVLFEVTKYGIGRHAPAGYESDMPAFEKTMSDAEIVATLAYIKSQWSPSILHKRAAAGMN